MAIENTKVVIEALIKKLENTYNEFYGDPDFTEQLIRDILMSIKDQNDYEKIISLNAINKMNYEENPDDFAYDEFTPTP